MGTKFQSFWPFEDQYFRRTVHSEDEYELWTKHYDDGDVEVLDMTQERWNYTANASYANANKNLQAKENRLQVSSSQQQVRKKLFKHFGN